MIEFADKGTEDIFNGINSKEARKKLPTSLWITARRKLDQIDSVVNLSELKIPPGNRLELLTGEMKGKYSIRINIKYRICFVWNNNSPEMVEIVDYH